jgi:hypothetical protein
MFEKLFAQIAGSVVNKVVGSALGGSSSKPKSRPPIRFKRPESRSVKGLGSVSTTGPKRGVQSVGTGDSGSVGRLEERHARYMRPFSSRRSRTLSV